MTIYLDFETRSEADLEKVGAWAYSEHPSTEVICMCYAIDEGPVNEWSNWFLGEPHNARELGIPFPLLDALEKGHEIEAHSAAFEYAIWQNICVPRLGWPEVPLDRWRDNMATAAYYAMPMALDGLCRAMGLPGKDPSGEKLITKYSKLHLKTAKREIPEEDLAAFVRYCANDVEIERRAAYALGELPEEELAIFMHDFAVGARGLSLDGNGIETARIVVEQRAAELEEEFEALTGLSPGQVAKFRAWCAEAGVVLPNLQKDTIKELLEEGTIENEPGPQLTREVRRALEVRSRHAKASTKKLGAMARQRGRDGRARFQSRYHGAATGRNTGTGFQPLNLVRSWDKVAPEQLVRDVMVGDAKWLDCLYGDATEAVSKASRHWITCAKGSRILAGDFASIEAVVNACLAGEEWKVQLFREKGDPYVAFASQATGRKVLPKSDPAHTKQDLEDRQKIGKPGELAFGYQGAVNAWRKFDSSDAWDDQDILGFVRAWREQHPMIVDQWKGLEAAALEAVNYPGRVTGHREIGFERVDGWLTMILLDGKRLWYWAPQIRMAWPQWHQPTENEDCATGECGCKMRPQVTYMAQKEGRWRRVASYGGKWCLAAGTQVLTYSGWKDIVNVQVYDFLWDGENWVRHGGLVFNGAKEVVDLEGVIMTPDHLVLTTEGWRDASQSEGYHRAACRLPDGPGIRWQRWQEVPVAGEVHLRSDGYYAGHGTGETEEPGHRSVVRLHEAGDHISQTDHAWHVQASGVSRLAGYDSALRSPVASRLEQLRRTGHQGLRALGTVFREFLGRHGGHLSPWAADRAGRQRRELRAGELPLGHSWGPVQQSASECPLRHAEGAHDRGPSGSGFWGQEDYPALAPAKRLAGRQGVYDLLNAGPNNRFTVRDGRGRSLLVHNCENAVQAVSRQILKANELRIDREWGGPLRKSGYLAPGSTPVVLSVYDEIVCEVPDGFGSIEEMQEIMAEPAGDWCRDWPIRAEVWSGVRYKK